MTDTRNLLRCLKEINYKIEEAISILQSEENDSELEATIKKESIEDSISTILDKLGAPMKNYGYLYIIKATMLCIENPKLFNGIAKHLYPKIANEFNTTPSRVERAIRYEKKVIFEKGNLNYLEKIFPNLHDRSISNSEFIIRLVDYVKSI